MSLNILTQFKGGAWIAALATQPDARGCRYLVWADHVIVFFVESFTSSQDISRTLNCEAGVVATMASVQWLHITRIVAGCCYSNFLLDSCYELFKLLITMAPCWAQVATIATHNHALVGRDIIFGTE